MKLRPIALLACALVVGLSACREDPTEANVGDPEAIVTNRSQTTQTVGAAFTVTAFTVDKNLQRIPGQLAAAVVGAGVSVDSAIYDPILTETDIFLRATARTTDAVMTVTGHGLSKDVKVIVN
ncbi:MAG: hypothetical protein ACT4O1_08750 [Gemmatimonadota bacterium]